MHPLFPKTKVKKKITFGSLLSDHLHSNKKMPNAIPYVTSYYKKYWGFCIQYSYLKKLKKKYSKSQIFKVFMCYRYVICLIFITAKRETYKLSLHRIQRGSFTVHRYY